MRSTALAIATAVLLLLLGPPPSAIAAPGWQWPVRGRVITPYRNGSDPYAGGQHRGIDIAAPVGTPVAVATAGTVTFAGPLGSSGLTVDVRTADGRLDTSYLHLSSVRVAAGDVVASGDGLGAVGTTGRRSAAEPHLHFGVRDAGSRFAYHDPLELLPIAPPSSSAPPLAPRAVPLPVGVPADPATAPAAVAAPGGIAANVGAPLAAVAAPLAAAGAGPQAGGVALPNPGPLTGSRGSSPAGLRLGAASNGAASNRSGTASSRRAAAQRRGRIPAAVPSPGAGPRGAQVSAPGPAGPNSALYGISAHAAERGRRGRPHDDLDPGWLVACVGLVGAAVTLGRPARTARSVRTRFAPERAAIGSSQPATRG
jgi:peptidase M23-like protein